jgi:hypothetical protein
MSSHIERVDLCGLPLDAESSYAINRSYFFHFRSMYRGHLAVKGPHHPDVLFYFQQLRSYPACLIAALPSAPSQQVPEFCPVCGWVGLLSDSYPTAAGDACPACVQAFAESIAGRLELAR